MKKPDMPKSLRRTAKQLAGLAYQREQKKALESLRRDFDRWESGEIDCWKLTDLIHRFHNGESRDLYKFYEMGKVEFALARAIELDILGEDEVPQALRESLQLTIDSFRAERSEGGQEPADESR